MSDWRIETHVGNPSMARVVGPKFKQMPECEGGGWYTDVATAKQIAAAPELLAALSAELEHLERANAAYQGRQGVNDSDLLSRIAAARAAIAKATAR